MLSIISKKLYKLAAGEATKPEGVSSQEGQDEEVEDQDSLSLLRSCADDFVLLMRTIDDKDELKENIKALYSLIHKFDSKITAVCAGMQKVLNFDEKSEGSELSEFVDSLKLLNKELIPFVELSSTLKDLANRGSANLEKEKKHKPIEHKAPKKEKFEPGRSKEKAKII